MNLDLACGGSSLKLFRTEKNQGLGLILKLFREDTNQEVGT